MTESRAEQHARGLQAAALVARWYGTNVGHLEAFTVEATQGPEGPSYRASATLTTPLTAEEYAEYRALISDEEQDALDHSGK